jgi:hypothetical protein
MELFHLFSKLEHLVTKGDQIMSAVTDFTTKMEAHFAKLNTDLDALAATVASLRAQVAAGSGALATTDQAALDATETTATATVAKADTTAAA